MKCFEVVRNVLNETYGAIPGSEEYKDAAIRQALGRMSDQYKNRLLTEGGPDFSDPVVRFAYVFLYVPVHAHWLYETMTWHNEIASLFDNPRVRVACLGGGPGSDLVGVLKYMTNYEKTSRVLCEIVDGCLNWKTTWSDLAHTLDWGSPLHTDYVIHQIDQNSSWRSSPCQFSKTDLFTLSFFVSEITRLGQANDYLRWALSQAKSGSLVVFNDNNDSRFYDWFDQTAEELNFEQLFSRSGERKIYDVAECKDVVGHFKDKFNFTPKLSGNLISRVLRKA